MDLGPNTSRRLEAIILAAGKGTRMGGNMPKVLHPVADRPMVHWVLEACERAGCDRAVVVIGHEAEEVERALEDHPDAVFAEQSEQLGTGHAVMQAAENYHAREDTDVLVLCGDGPLIREETIRRVVERHRESGAAATLATAVLEDPTGSGRIIREEGGAFARIVEEKDADETERRITEVNPSYYCFRAADLFDALERIENDNAKGEYYLTDALEVLVSAGERVEVVDTVPAEDVLSINTPEQLEAVDRVLRRRIEVEAEE